MNKKIISSWIEKGVAATVIVILVLSVATAKKTAGDKPGDVVVMITENPLSAEDSNLTTKTKAVEKKQLVAHVTGSGYRQLSYQWRKNDVPIKGATGSIYTLIRETYSDVSRYDCLVTCGKGSFFQHWLARVTGLGKKK